MTREAMWGMAENFLMVGAMVWISFVIGFAMGGDYVRRAAIQSGAAAEFVDAETGEVRFEWK